MNELPPWEAVEASDTFKALSPEDKLYHRTEYDRQAAFPEQRPIASQQPAVSAPPEKAPPENPAYVPWDKVTASKTFKSATPEDQKHYRKEWKRQYLPEDRSFPASVGSHIMRGVARTASMVGHGLELADFTPTDVDTEQGLFDKAGKAIRTWGEEAPSRSGIYRPDIAEQDEGFFGSTFGSAVESAPLMAVPFAMAKGGAMAGTAVGGPVGAAVGGIGGGLLGLVGTFFAGTYGESRKEALSTLKDRNPDMTDEEIRDKAHTHGMTSGLYEAVPEAASDILMYFTAGGSKLITEGGKAALKTLLKGGPKDFVKRLGTAYAKNAPMEAGTEMLTEYGQKKSEMENLGVGEGAQFSDYSHAAGAALWMALGANVAGTSMDEIQSRQAFDAVNSENPESRIQAASYIAGKINESTGDSELAENWQKEAVQLINDGQEIPTGERIDSIGDKSVTPTDPVNNQQDLDAEISEVEQSLANVFGEGGIGAFEEENRQGEAEELMGSMADTMEDVQYQDDIKGRRQGFANMQPEVLAQENANLHNSVMNKLQENRENSFTPEEEEYFNEYTDAKEAEFKKTDERKKKADRLREMEKVEEYQPSTPGLVEQREEDILNQFADDAQTLQEQGEKKATETMSAQFDKQVQESQAYTALKNIKQKKERELTPEEDAFMAEYDPNPPGYVEPQASFEEQAMDKMLSDVEAGAVSGSFQDQEGTTTPTQSSYPEWFKQKTVKKYNKENGTKVALSKDTLKKLFAKIRSGKELTARQQETYDYLQTVSGEYLGKDPELVASQEYTRLEDEGFELGAPESVNVGDLNPGDEVVIEKGGVPDKLTHMGYDKDGNAMLQDGQLITADEFDTVEVISSKIKGESAGRKKVDAMVKQITESSTIEDVENLKAEMPDFIEKNPDFKPYRELILGTLERREAVLNNDLKKYQEADDAISKFESDLLGSMADTAESVQGQDAAKVVKEKAKGLQSKQEAVTGVSNDKTYDYFQDKIDDIVDKQLDAGFTHRDVNEALMALDDRGYGEVLKGEEGSIPIDDIALLADMYRQRDAVGDIELVDFISIVSKDTGLSEKDAKSALAAINIDSDGMFGQADAAETLEKFGVNFFSNLGKLYNHFADSGTGKPYSKEFAEFRLGGTPERETIAAMAYDEDSKPINLRVDLLKKVESVYNAISKSQSGDTINITSLAGETKTSKEIDKYNGKTTPKTETKAPVEQKTSPDGSKTTTKESSEPVSGEDQYKLNKLSIKELRALAAAYGVEYEFGKKGITKDVVRRDVENAMAADDKKKDVKSLLEGKEPTPPDENATEEEWQAYDDAMDEYMTQDVEKQEVAVEKVEITKSNGEPFKSRVGAKSAITKAKVEGYEVVKVDGGYVGQELDGNKLKAEAQSRYDNVVEGAKDLFTEEKSESAEMLARRIVETVVRRTYKFKDKKQPAFQFADDVKTLGLEEKGVALRIAESVFVKSDTETAAEKVTGVKFSKAGKPKESKKSKFKGGPNEFTIDETNRNITNQLEKVLKRTGADITVTPISLPDSLFSDGKTKGKAAKSDFDLAQKLSKVFGKDIVWAEIGDAETINGVVVRVGKLNNKIFLDVRSEIPQHVILGHELSHFMETEAGTIYKKLVDSLEPLLKSREDYRKRFGLDEQMTRKDITAEMVGDLLGDSFADTQFWKDVAQSNPGKFRSIANTVMRWLNGLLRKVSQPKYGFKSEQLVTDIRKARVALAQATAEYATQKKGATADSANVLFSGAFGDAIDFVKEKEVPLFSAKPRMPKKFLDAAKKVTDTANFKNWFGKSKIKSNGEPHILYHGTSHPQFLKDKDYPWVFDTDKAVNQASSPLAGLGVFLGNDTIASAHSTGTEGTAHPFFVKIENPLVMTSDELEAKVNSVESAKAFRKRAMDLNGYDGIIISDRGHVIAFNPNQLKSAKDNTGEFSTTEDDVRYSVADQKKATNTENISATGKGKTEEGKKLLQKLMADMRKAATTKVEKERVSKTREQKYVEQFRKLEQIAKDSHSSIASKQKALASFLQAIPAPVAKKVVTPLSVISRYKGTPTHVKRLAEALQRTDKELTSYLHKTISADIRKKLKPRKMPKNRVAKSTLGYEAESDLQFIREAISTTDIHDQIATLESQDGTESQVNALLVFGDIKSKNLHELVDARAELDSIIKTGRASWRAVQEQWKKTFEENNTVLHREIAGIEAPQIETKPEETKRKAEIQTAKGQVKKFGGWVENSILSWEFLVDKISTNSGKGSLKSESVEMFGSQAQAATREENQYNRESVETIRENAMRIFGAKSPKELNKMFEKLSVKEAGKVHTADGQDFLISPMEAAYWYAIRKNGDSVATWDAHGVTDKTFSEIESYMSPELKEWSDFLVDGFLQDFHEPVNDVYKAINGINLTKTPGYITWNRDVAVKIDDAGFASKAESGVGGMSKGAHKQRVANTNMFKVMSLNDVVMNHISDMNNYRAWAIPSKVINGSFNNKKTQKLIEQYHSIDTLKAVKSFQKDFAKSPEELRGDMPWLDRLRGNITTAMVGANPTIFLKQQTSIPAMMESIPAAQWVKYSGKFWTNPRKAWNTIKQSSEFKARMDKGMERDIRTAQRVSGSSAISGSSGLVRDLSQKSMFLVKTGDAMAVVIGGYPVYQYHYDQQVGKLGKAKAHEFAIRKFESAMDRTQQASGVKDQGRVQRGGSYMKLFTMFMTAPSAYTRNMTSAIRNYKNDPVGSSKRIAIFGVMMPALFQMTASGFLGLLPGDEDNDELGKDVIASILMSLGNGIPVIRDIQKGIYNSAMGQWYGRDIDYSPITEVGKSLTDVVRDGFKAIAKDRTPEQREASVYKSLNSMADTMGYMSGLPVQPVRRWLFDNISDIASGNTGYPIRRAIGYSASAMKERDGLFNKYASEVLGAERHPLKSYTKSVKRRISRIKERPQNSATRGIIKDIQDRYVQSVRSMG